jgi:hypothetical protein
MISNTKPEMRSSAVKPAAQTAAPAQGEPDDRFPGSFFRIPGVPQPGKTTWSLAK